MVLFPKELGFFPQGKTCSVCDAGGLGCLPRSERAPAAHLEQQPSVLGGAEEGGGPALPVATPGSAQLVSPLSGLPNYTPISSANTSSKQALKSKPTSK